jgi:hypothetical protein
MENANGNDINPENDVNEEIVADENDDTSALTEKLQKVSEANKQLFARAKKAEGFELKEGKWIKPAVKAKEKVEPQPSTKEPSQPGELDYGQLALLRTEGIKGSGELALFKEIMAETGKGVLDVMDSNYFKSRLADYREAQESANAIPKGKNRSGQTGVTDTDLNVAKYKESGILPDDFKSRVATIKQIAEAEKMEGVFSGPSVIGPKMQ